MTDREDLRAEQERHQRRLMLMREQGKVNRQEDRLTALWVICGVLLILVLALAT